MTEAHGVSALTLDEVKTLLRKAEQGDTTVLPALRTWMDQTPGYWEEVGDLAHTARASLIRSLSGDNLLVQEAHARTCAALMEEIAGPQPSPLERLLVERIVLCGLHLHYHETLYVQNLEKFTLRQDEYYQQRITKAQARYLSAIRTLAHVRRLGVPAVQVNIGQQQVNVTGESAGPLMPRSGQHVQ